MSRHEFGPLPEYSDEYIALASAILNVPLLDNEKGFSLARTVLAERHEKVMPTSDILTTVHQIIGQNGDVAESIGQAASAITRVDIPKALEASNHVFYYGMIDFEDHLRSNVFTESVSIHRSLGELLLSTSEDIPDSERADREIINVNPSGNPLAELVITRRMIHSLIAGGLGGEEAKRYVDPWAILPPL